MRRGFTIIEILIAMLILFMAIIFVNMSIKAFNSYQRKAEIYQNFYFTALSLKDWISQQPLTKEVYKGKLNGLEYRFNIKLLTQKKNYTVSIEHGGGNYGSIMVKLYHLEMILKSKKHEQRFKFYLTRELSLYTPTPIKEGIE